MISTNFLLCNTLADQGVVQWARIGFVFGELERMSLSIVDPRYFRIRVLDGLIVVAFLISGILVGCHSPEASDEVDRRGSNLQSLAGLYRTYAAQHGGNPPPNEAAFKTFIQDQGLKHFESFGITTIDELFISPRDRKPYVVIYGDGPEEMPNIVAYEREGTETGRWIASSMTVVAEVDEVKFQQMVPNEARR